MKTKDDKDIKAIACFVISPKHRKQGIATKLLEHAMRQAQKEGYKYIEAYPDSEHKDCYMNYHGYKLMFEHEGFQGFQELEKCAIMRKEL